ncbi:unnamed protein product [Eruca vesicaria subsp. sativa]|uniref:Mediator of RNA polymerase II transcription subunit 8 n=1 Tax=Eruca vesicaria subsp. sativa TaxID=29727 RepID=A0ABC8LW61_ERUVS|nr:unnamed protein product [Eruca vesicaria subsp. sativa]
MERATQPPPVAEEQNQEAEQLQNLAYVKTQALSLMKTISRVLEEVSAYTETNTTPKWFPSSRLPPTHFILQLVSKNLVVFPKNVNAENASILPVMLSTKLLPEMETDNNVKREGLLQEVQSLPIATQIETLKERIGKIAEACESAAKEMADARKAYGFPPHSGLSMSPFPTMDKVQAAKILDQENMLRGSVNEGTGLMPPDQREITTSLPPHMVAALFDPGNNVASNNINSQEDLMQVSGTQLMESSAASSSGANFDTTGPTRHASPTLGDQMSNSSGMMQTQESQSEQQQQQQQGEGGRGHGNMQTN